MSIKTIYYPYLGACEECDNCLEKNYPYYYCARNNDNFGDISYPEDCDEYADSGYYNDDDEEVPDRNEPIECPRCGNDAYWGGSNYECEQCGWCGWPND
ncbi:hypothetical protein [Prevotella nigrescens]|uniref:hypothetical protein n=1 Tax=Prevotella nigrescens TaxID=28133 RepID=UPI001C5CE50B|nr:hypothetical protein [Prevotella nigrescens]MBW4727051.1 hypothetical protein [Prevotella nigrescens]